MRDSLFSSQCKWRPSWWKKSQCWWSGIDKK